MKTTFVSLPVALFQNRTLCNKFLKTYFGRTFSIMARKDLCLFDIDGTLTPSRQQISHEMKNLLSELQKKVTVGLVGGSDLNKIAEQMGDGMHILKVYDYVFAENGLVAYKKGKLIEQENILSYMGEEKIQTFINFCLEYMSKLRLPAKRGNFIEFRTGLVNVCPVGRSCNQKEREEFNAYDKIHKVRENFVNALREKFPDLGLVYSIGGQISFDCFPVGWDKTFCLRHIDEGVYVNIYFFGDKTSKGGNDFEIFCHERIKGNTVTCPEDTIGKLKEMFFS